MSEVKIENSPDEEIVYSFRQGLNTLFLGRGQPAPRQTPNHIDRYIADQAIIRHEIQRAENALKLEPDQVFARRLAAAKKATLKDSESKRPWRFDQNEPVWIKNCEIYDWWVGYVTDEFHETNFVEVSYYGGRNEIPWIGPYSQIIPFVEGWEEGVKLGGQIGEPSLLKKDIELALLAYLGPNRIETEGRALRWPKYCNLVYPQIVQLEDVPPLPVLANLPRVSYFWDRPPKPVPTPRILPDDVIDVTKSETTPATEHSMEFSDLNNDMSLAMKTRRSSMATMLDSKPSQFCHLAIAGGAYGSKEICHMNVLFFRAIHSGDLEIASELIKKNVMMNQVDPETGNFGLHIAIHDGNLKLLTILLDAHVEQHGKLDPATNIKTFNASKLFDRNGLSPLHLAMKLGRYKMIPHIVPHIPVLHCPGRNGYTALSWAAMKDDSNAESFSNRLKAADVLLRLCSVDDSTTKSGKKKGDGKTHNGRPVLYINALDKNQRTPYYWSIVNELPELGELLFRYGGRLSSSREIADVCADLSLGLEPTPIRITSFLNLDGEIALPRFFYCRTTIGNPPNFKPGMHKCQCNGHCDHSCPCTGQNGQQLPYNEEKCLVHGYKSVIYECGPQCNCNCGASGGVLRLSQEGVSAKLEVFHMGPKGWGVKTLEVLPKGKFLFLYGGVVTNLKKSKRYDFNNYTIEVVNACGKGDLSFDASVVGNVSRLVNHSCEPNLMLRKVSCGLTYIQVGFFTNQVISPGTELTWGYDNAPTRKDFQCMCRSKKCKGHI